MCVDSLQRSCCKAFLYVLDCRTFESALKDGSASENVSVFTERTDPSSAEQYFQVYFLLFCSYYCCKYCYYLLL